MVPGRRGEILLHVRVLQNQNQEKGLAPHQHRQEVDGIVTVNPTKPHRVLLVHARVRFRVGKSVYPTIINILLMMLPCGMNFNLSISRMESGRRNAGMCGYRN